MANYTVFGSGVPSYTLTAYGDGFPAIILGNYFYTYGSGVGGWRCRGGRLYVAPHDNLYGREVALMAWKVTTSPVDLSTAPLKAGTAIVGPSGGWVEALWDEPFTIAPGEFIFIGYQFVGEEVDQWYVHSPSPSPTYVRSSDDVNLVLAEATISTTSPTTQRAQYRMGTGSTVYGTAWYGVDIMVDDGAVPVPIAEYGFNETSGTTAYDSSGNGRHLTLNASSNLGIGKTGNGLHQVGGGLPNRITNSAPWLETTYRTIMFWGRRGSEGAGEWSPSVFQLEQGSSVECPIAVSMNDDSENLYFAVRRGNGSTVHVRIPEITLGTWAHYTITFDQLYMRAYVDGELVGEELIFITGPLNDSDGNLYLFGGDYQQQIIDDLRFFDVALSEAQIQQYMNMAIEPPDTEPPSVPANVGANVNYQQVTLNWDDSTDNIELQNYFVYRSATSGFTPGPGDLVGSPAPSMYVETAPVGTWYYRVSARDEAGNESAPCAEIEVVTTQAPVVENYLFPSDLGWSVGSEVTDTNLPNGFSVGIVCALSGPSYISGGRFYSPIIKPGCEVRLFENGVEVAVKTGFDLVVGWNELLFDDPYVGVGGTDYLLSVYMPGPGYTITSLPNAFTGARVEVGPMYTTLVGNSRWGVNRTMPGTAVSAWYGIDIISPNIDATIDPTFGATIAEENEKQGNMASEWTISGAGDSANLGFARQFSLNSGETVEFSCDGNGTDIDIYRIGYYGGLGWRKVASLTNTATDQPDPLTIPNSNGGVTCSNWSVTANWDVPEEALSGLYVGVYRNQTADNASYIPFIIRNDDRTADVAYKTSDTTWALAYNYYGTPASPYTGKSLYGSGGPMGAIGTRAHAATYHRPIVTREGISQTYWLACEAPMIRFLERNGIDVKYVASCDIDANTTVIDNAKIMVSNGHDEYWSIGMRDNAEAFRDAGGHILFFSGNEVFWRTRFEPDRNTMWCYKDTAQGPVSHVAGTPLDPVTWTGTWKDTRFPGRKPENTITGTDFRMNGVNDYGALLSTNASYAAHVFWRNSQLLDGNVFAPGIIGFEADSMLPTQPVLSTSVLANYTINVDGKYADDNGQEYNGNGDLSWGVVSQRYASGAVVVGFGTCQWSWALDSTHDRGSNYVRPALQQATLNLFADLGAAPATIMSGMTTPVAASLNNYGVVPASGRSGKVKVWDGSQWTAHPLKVWNGTSWEIKPILGTEDGENFTLGKD